MYPSRTRLVALGLLILLALIPRFSSAAQSSPTPAVPLVGSTAPTAIKDHYIVVLKEDITPQALSDLEQVVRGMGGTIRFRYTAALTGFAAQLPAAVVDRLRQDTRIAYIQADQYVQLDPPARAQDLAPRAVGSWGLDRLDQRQLPLNQTYSSVATGVGVTAYILDTGVRATHTEFGGRAVNVFDAFGGNGNDCHGHGTHVAGTVGGVTYGVAKQVHVRGLRVLDCNGSGSESGVIAGIDWVTANRVLPAVANMSLGFNAPSPAVDAAVRRSIVSGVTYVVAAGNANSDACATSPARTAEALTVAATDTQDTRAAFSNYGSCVDLFAPGVDIVSAWNTSDTAIMTLRGTSMAAPHVAGVAALYLQSNPSASPAAAASAILNGATFGVVINPGPGSPNRLLYGSTCFGQFATIEGTLGDDTLAGTAGNDVIVGYAGNDTLFGLGGHDAICGYEGRDTIYGGTSDLQAPDGDDRLHGNVDDDQIFAGMGNDIAHGGMGNDTLTGNVGSDIVSGDAGNDVLYGGQNDDTMYGGDGDDWITGDLGYDTIDGQAGTDTCTAEVTYNCP